MKAAIAENPDKIVELFTCKPAIDYSPDLLPPIAPTLQRSWLGASFKRYIKRQHSHHLTTAAVKASYSNGPVSKAIFRNQ